MKLPRRSFLNLAVGAAALPLLSQVARAQTYPTRPVRIIVGVAAGGSPDIFARLIGQSLSERLGKPFVIENRSGGGGNIATEAVVNSQPDGYTLLMVATNDAINATLYEKLSFNFIRDIAPVASMVLSSNVMVVHPSVPAKTVPEFLAYARANPGKIDMASPGIGTSSHVAGELFKMMTGVDMAHVPYRGAGQALTDLLSGQVQVMIASTAASIVHIRSGKLNPLAVTTSSRLEVLPGIPTVSEFVPGYQASGWFGIGAPKNTPAEIVDKLNKEINAALADPKIKARLADLGGMPLSMTPAEFGKFVADETEVGQGDPYRQHQGRIGRAVSRSITSRCRNRSRELPTLSLVSPSVCFAIQQRPRCRRWVKTGKSRGEKMSSNLPPKADVGSAVESTRLRYWLFA